MKLQRSTVVLVGVALLLGAGVFISEAHRSQSSRSEQADKSATSIFNFQEQDVTALTVERPGETLEFKRDGQGTWQMVRPTPTAAEEGAIAFLISRLITDAPLRKITVTPDQQAQFGFDKPSGSVKLTLKDGTTHTVTLGAKDFSGNALYALVDQPQVPLPKTAGSVPLYVVVQDVANGVDRPLAEWKAPPAASTATTGANPASTPTATAGSTPTTIAPPASQPAPAASTPSSAPSTPTAGAKTEAQQTSPNKPK